MDKSFVNYEMIKSSRIEFAFMTQIIIFFISLIDFFILRINENTLHAMMITLALDNEHQTLER